MTRILLYASLIFSLLAVQVNAQPRSQMDEELLYPEVPRISAYEAYIKYKERKALILHAGGDLYSKRHIAGAFNLEMDDNEKMIVKFPKTGIELFTYCY